MKKLRACFLGWFALLLGSQGVLADGFIIIDRPVPLPEHRHPHPHPRPPRPIHQYLPLEVKNHFVSVKIDGQVAVTSVDQTFHNPSGQRLEGTYLFPIPEGAEIDQFEMDVNGEMMEAELLDAGKARKIYEDIVRRAKDPALMEYVGQGLFKVRIFPIEPRSDKRVKLKYTQVLKRDGRLVDYTYPLNTEKFSSRPVGEVSVKVDVRAESGIKSIYSPSHEIEVTRKGEKRAVIGFEEKNTRPDTDFKLLYATDHQDSQAVGLEMLTYSPKKGGDEGHFMMLVSPGAWEKKDKIVPKDIVFVLDTSGSMRTKKLEQAKAALEFCLDNLNAGDRFEIVRYSTEAEALFEGLMPADDEHLTLANEYIDELKAGGGTAIEEALLQSVSYASGREDGDRPYQVIFLTDGRPTIGETRPDKILERLKDKVGSARVFCFGIGTDINTKLLDLVAEETRAVTEYVLPEEDIEHKVSRFYSKIAVPVMANLKLTVKGGGARLTQRYPNDLPDLFKGDQLVVFGRYKKGEKSKVKLQLEGSLGGEKKAFTYRARLEGSRDHQFIPRLWATRRVGYLLDEIRLRGESSELREEVVSLARKYGIVTPYTSYLIVEDEMARDVPVARQSMGNRRGLSLEGGGGTGRPAVNAAPDPASVQLARDAEKAAYESFADAESGAEAVAGARASSKLKAAKTPSATRAAFRESQYAGQAGGGKRLVAQETKFLGGKTFYQNGAEWIDGDAQALGEAAAIEIEFGSDGYFELLSRSTEIARWLSAGDSMQVIIADQLYKVVPTK
ncbi:MAG: Ca-activated chloride channel family protein [Pseudoalteromonas tetraodonis]|jgi:Ca-activated chloride channel family protein